MEKETSAGTRVQLLHHSDHTGQTYGYTVREQEYLGTWHVIYQGGDYAAARKAYQGAR